MNRGDDTFTPKVATGREARVEEKKDSIFKLRGYSFNHFVGNVVERRCFAVFQPADSS